MRVRRTLAAERDGDGVLDETVRLFGERQLHLYAELIDRTIDRLGERSAHAASRARPDVGPGVRSLRLGGGAAHQVFFIVRAGPNQAEPEEVVILRVLHMRMAVRHRVTAALRGVMRS